MSEFQIIESALRRAAHRRKRQRLWEGWWRGLLAGGLVWLGVLCVYKLAPIPKWSLTAAGGLAGLTLLASLAPAALRRGSLLETARWLDQHQHWQERLSTAWEVSGSAASDEWKQLVVADAAGHAKQLDPRTLLPLRLPRASKWALLVILLAAGLGFVPAYRSKAYLQKQRDATVIRDTGKHLAEFARQAIAERRPALETAQQSLEAAAELGEKLSKASLTRGEALRDLASVTEKLGRQAQELGQNPALKPLERAARESGGSGAQSPDKLQQQMQALQKALGNAGPNAEKLDQLQRDLQKAQQALANLPNQDSAAGKAAREQLAQSLSDLGKQASDLGQSLPGLEEALKALQNNQTDLALRDVQSALKDLDKLRDMAQTLQQLQQQAARAGKDLAEQLRFGQAQAAGQTLRKMAEQLQGAGLAPEQLQKILDEVARSVEPARQYGQVGEHLKNATQRLRQGEKSPAAQSLAQAAEELDKLLQQMGDAQAMLDTLNACEKAQVAIAMGKGWDESQGSCPGCNGQGCALCRGKGKGWGRGGKPGGGVGTWADETGYNYLPGQQEQWDNSGIQRPDMDPRGLTDRPTELSPDLAPTKVRGQMSPGGSMPSITLKGVSIKGQSTVAYQEAAASAQAEAQSALNQDQVPRAYQNTVRDYFDDLKK